MEIPKEEDAKYKRMSVSQRQLVNIIILVHRMWSSCGRAVIELPIKEFSSFLPKNFINPKLSSAKLSTDISKTKNFIYCLFTFLNEL